MTLHPIPSEFPYIQGKFSFLFHQCGMCLHVVNTEAESITIDDEYGDSSSEHLFTQQEIKKHSFSSPDLKQRNNSGLSQNSYRRIQS
jgi:hypothetical protein